jgi:hypothetical protein
VQADDERRRFRAVEADRYSRVLPDETIVPATAVVRLGKKKTA